MLTARSHRFSLDGRRGGVCYGRFTGKTPVANLSPEPDMRDVTKRAVKILSQRHIPPPSFTRYLGTVYSMDYR